MTINCMLLNKRPKGLYVRDFNKHSFDFIPDFTFEERKVKPIGQFSIL